jgi:hypothetical protein
MMLEGWHPLKRSRAANPNRNNIKALLAMLCVAVYALPTQSVGSRLYEVFTLGIQFL